MEAEDLPQAPSRPRDAPGPGDCGPPRPPVIAVSSPWPAVVVASRRPRAPVGSPWPRVIVNPRSWVIVGSPRARVAGAHQASAPSQGAPQVRRQDEHSGAGAEGPRPDEAAPAVGARATSGFGRRWVWAGRRRHRTGLRPNPAAQLGQLLLRSVPSPPPPAPPGAVAGGGAEGQEWVESPFPSTPPSA